jgi:hypothetical protein
MIYCTCKQRPFCIGAQRRGWLLTRTTHHSTARKMTTSVGNGRRAALFMHVVVGDLLTLQIPTSVIEINES